MFRRSMTNTRLFSSDMWRRAGGVCFKQQRLFSSSVTYKKENQHSSRSKYWYASGGLITMASIFGSYQLYAKEIEDIDDEETDEFKDIVEEKIQPGTVDSKLEYYTKKDIAKHDNLKDGIWVYYKHGVYDITEFVESHPGGVDRIMLAAGGNIEPYWKIYGQHHNESVYEILESWRIGNLKDYERPKHNNEDGPFADEPERSPLFVVNSETPFNAETPIILLCENFITPNTLFYVRNHLPVPLVDPETYRLEILGEDGKGIGKSYSLDELKKFKHHTITATVQCAGNRRNGLDKVSKVRGLSWKGGAIGNATWTGVLLSDVIKDAGYNNSGTTKEHCIFVGLDGDGVGTSYEASVPLKKVLDQYGDVLLAFEMNGEELPRDHGYPIRVIVPGYVGARNVKWLSKVIISDTESNSHWQKKDYKSFSPATDWNNIDWSSAPAIQEMPVQSLICSPLTGSVLSEDVDEVTFVGYAWSGGGKDIIRVDISVNDVWYEAELCDKSVSETDQRWSWKLWKVTIPLSEDEKEFIVKCRAVDSAYNTQPEGTASIWNSRGVNNNSWHTVHLHKE